MRLNKNGAVGLSMNVLVVIILSLVILGGGISLLYKFLDISEQTKERLDLQTKAELEQLMLDQGQIVAISPHTLKLNPKESGIIGLGINNLEDENNGPDSFYILVSAVDPDIVVDDWVLYINDEKIIKDNEFDNNNLINVEVPANTPSGRYFFKIKVFKNNEAYGNVLRFEVYVK